MTHFPLKHFLFFPFFFRSNGFEITILTETTAEANKTTEKGLMSRPWASVEEASKTEQRTQTD